jgi:hypothetical protein
MPSKQLSQLVQQIEQQDTDHFAKFYMYVSLLNMIAFRNKNKTFAEGLPHYSKGNSFWQDNTLKFGNLPMSFYNETSEYSRAFTNTQPLWLNSLYNIVSSYLRKGKVSDLVFIIDQMFNHLTAIEGHQSHNQKIYKYIDFKEKKAGLTAFIRQVSDFNHEVLSLVDNGVNSSIAIAAATVGLIMILASVFALVPTLLGLALMIGGAYAAYSYASQVDKQINGLQEKMNAIKEKTQQLSQDESLFGNKNHDAFFSAVVIPMPYAAITAGEQVIFDEKQQTDLVEERQALDTMFRLPA